MFDQSWIKKNMNIMHTPMSIYIYYLGYLSNFLDFFPILNRKKCNKNHNNLFLPLINLGLTDI